jgi:hypothetical protein
VSTKTAAELVVGDVFRRDGRPNSQYRVLAVQSVPIYGFFGNLYDTIQVTVDHHLTGRVDLNLSPDEVVQLVPPDEVAARAAPSARPGWIRRRRSS